MRIQYYRIFVTTQLLLGEVPNLAVAFSNSCLLLLFAWTLSCVVCVFCPCLFNHVPCHRRELCRVHTADRGSWMLPEVASNASSWQVTVSKYVGRALCAAACCVWPPFLQRLTGVLAQRRAHISASSHCSWCYCLSSCLLFSRRFHFEH